MSLATRCTSCNTVFRVVQDQLKVSEGWVRCGRCHEVFNALESLFDLEPAAAAAAAAPASESTGTAAAALQVVEPKADASPTPDAAPEPSPPPEPPSPAAPANDTASTSGAILPAEPAAKPETAVRSSLPAPAPAAAALQAWPPPAFDATSRAGFGNAETSPASRLDARDRNDFEDARFNSEWFADESLVPAADAAVEAAAPLIDGVAPAEADEGAVRPEFLRRAEQRARWDRPAVAVVMATACGLLLLVLAGQVAHHFRDLIAATYPQTRPALLALCEVSGCRIEPLRRIEDIVIESSALTGAPSGNAIRLSVVLRNRGALPLALPAIELSLTDPSGQLLARRALLPADFAMAGATLAASAETPLQLVLAVDGRRPSGYTVEPFYP